MRCTSGAAAIFGWSGSSSQLWKYMTNGDVYVRIQRATACLSSVCGIWRNQLPPAIGTCAPNTLALEIGNSQRERSPLRCMWAKRRHGSEAQRRKMGATLESYA